jgi:hypothetical protein
MSDAKPALGVPADRRNLSALKGIQFVTLLATNVA